MGPPPRRCSHLTPKLCSSQLLGQRTVTMSPTTAPRPDLSAYELRFESLFVEGRGLSFPCDAAGQVNLAALSERARHNYLRARSVVGREFRTPAVLPRWSA